MLGSSRPGMITCLYGALRAATMMHKRPAAHRCVDCAAAGLLLQRCLCRSSCRMVAGRMLIAYDVPAALGADD